jgi:hypothetical protein
MHGQGTLIDDYVYTGDFPHHKKHGKGIWNEKEDGLGDIYDGEWKDNEREGRGTCTYCEYHDVYTGQWAKGKREGQGVMTEDGSVYVGQWRRDAKDGDGTLTSDSTVLKGTWQCGRMHGAFIHSINGVEKQEQWVNGVQIQGDVASSSS